MTRFLRLAAFASVGLAGVLLPLSGGATTSILHAPNNLIVIGSDVWVADMSTSSTPKARLVELSSATGAVIHVVQGAKYDFTAGMPSDVYEALGSSGHDLWVSDLKGGNASSDAVTEVNASTGALVRVLRGVKYGFSVPSAFAVAGRDLWIANAGPTGYAEKGSLTEVNASTGALVRVVTGARFDFLGPQALAVVGDDLWVAGGGRLTEINAVTGALIRVSAAQTGLVPPGGLVALKGHLWIAGSLNSILTEINASTGAVMRVVRGSPTTFGLPSSATVVGTDLWISSPSPALAEINSTTGSVVRVVTGASYGLQFPRALFASGSRLWVVSNSSVSEINASSGALVRVIG